VYYVAVKAHFSLFSTTKVASHGTLEHTAAGLIYATLVVERVKRGCGISIPYSSIIAKPIF
jgi:hypothetical protein